MSGTRPYRVLLFGTQHELQRLHGGLAAAAEPIELELRDAEDASRLLLEGITEKPPDVAVIATSVERPLPIARHVRTVSPNSQIVFLLPDERLDRFRASLP
ncbi:MAG: hypothetical protein M3177_11485, partial [Pseudomonadota bacterium]|nr:hypothetical protein [Pseudomonadota bacterium]